MAGHVTVSDCAFGTVRRRWRRSPVRMSVGGRDDACPKVPVIGLRPDLLFGAFDANLTGELFEFGDGDPLGLCAEIFHPPGYLSDLLVGRVEADLFAVAV